MVWLLAAGVIAALASIPFARWLSDRVFAPARDPQRAGDMIKVFESDDWSEADLARRQLDDAGFRARMIDLEHRRMPLVYSEAARQARFEVYVRRADEEAAWNALNETPA
jgi:hypothetical protein